jgi:hypothetical protein
MQNRISWFKSFALVNGQRCWEEASLYYRDYHDPPHATRPGFHDVKSPPRRLAEVARPDPRRTPPAGVVFPRDVIRTRRLPRHFRSEPSRSDLTMLAGRLSGSPIRS